MYTLNPMHSKTKVQFYVQIKKYFVGILTLYFDTNISDSERSNYIGLMT